MSRGGGEVGARARTLGFRSLCANLCRPPTFSETYNFGKGLAAVGLCLLGLLGGLLGNTRLSVFESSVSSELAAELRRAFPGPLWVEALLLVLRASRCPEMNRRPLVFIYCFLRTSPSPCPILSPVDPWISRSLSQKLWESCRESADAAPGLTMFTQEPRAIRWGN